MATQKTDLNRERNQITLVVLTSAVVGGRCRHKERERGRQREIISVNRCLAVWVFSCVCRCQIIPSLMTHLPASHWQIVACSSCSSGWSILQPKKCTMRTTTQRYERSTYCVVLIVEEWTGNGFNDTHNDGERQSETFSEKPKKARRGNTLSCCFGYCIIAESSSSVLNQAKGKLNLPRIFSTLFHRPKTTPKRETRTENEHKTWLRK